MIFILYNQVIVVHKTIQKKRILYGRLLNIRKNYDQSKKKQKGKIEFLFSFFRIVKLESIKKTTTVVIILWNLLRSSSHHHYYLASKKKFYYIEQKWIIIFFASEEKLWFFMNEWMNECSVWVQMFSCSHWYSPMRKSIDGYLLINFSQLSLNQKTKQQASNWIDKLFWKKSKPTNQTNNLQIKDKLTKINNIDRTKSWQKNFPIK